MNNTVVIFSAEKSLRLTYVCDLIFEQLLGISYHIEDDPNLSCHVNYSTSSVSGNALQIKPHGLLFEKGIRDLRKEVEFEAWENSYACFRTEKDGTLPYDIFSASFFLLSRYEEYLDYFPDEHGRFTARESLQMIQNVLEEPLINQWTIILQKLLKEQYPDLKFHPRKFEYCSTLDIDQAWKYKHKGLYRNIAGFFRDALQGKWENFKERWPVLWGFKKDPFYNFDWINQLHQKHAVSSSFFILLGDKGEHDKNVSHYKKAFIELIQRLEKFPGSSLGIHPSYAAYHKPDQVKAEIKRLETILGHTIKKSRQHFLLHQFPETYRILMQSGILEEHTMGYSTHAGFRAGIAAPFYFYDLLEDKATDMLLIPFCLMDITPLHYMELEVEDAILYIKKLMTKVKAVDGLFVSLWHNESLAETERWKGWRVVYEKMIEESGTGVNT